MRGKGPRTVAGAFRMRGRAGMIQINARRRLRWQACRAAPVREPAAEVSMIQSALVLAPLAAVALVACSDGRAPEGRALYLDHCAACHGSAGRGDGPRAATLSGGAPDLTRIAARAGGTFPEARVMSVIDGYTRRDQHGSRMPEFGALLAGRQVLWQGPEGQPVPTPESLVALAGYLASIQR